MGTTPNYNGARKLCIFCYKPGLDEKLGSRLLLLLSRYVETPLNNAGEIDSEYRVVCEGCAKLGNSFCDLYFQLEAIKIELDWKVKKLCERMTHAGKVPARGLAFKNQFEGRRNGRQVGVEPYQSIQTLRRRLIKNCKRKQKTSQPSLILKRIEDKNIPIAELDGGADDVDKEEVQFSFPSSQQVPEIKNEPESDPLETENINHSFEAEDNSCQEDPLQMEFEETEIKVDIVHFDTGNMETETDPLDTSSSTLWSSSSSLTDTIDDRTTSSTPSSETGTSWVPPNQCETCRKSFSCEAEVEKHRVVSHQLKNYVRCPICSEMFAGYSFYRLHRTKQSSQPKCFTSDWNSLIPAAAPEYPYTTGGLSGGHYFCTFEGCTEVFQYEQRLQIHLGTHGEWKCICCGETFEKGHHLAWHELKMTKPVAGMPHQPQKQKSYKCTRCTRSFEQNLSMTNHFLKEHLGIPLKPQEKETKGARVQCPKCRKNVPQIMMEKHIQDVHSNTARTTHC